MNSSEPFAYLSKLAFAMQVLKPFTRERVAKTGPSMQNDKLLPWIYKNLLYIDLSSGCQKLKLFINEVVSR